MPREEFLKGVVGTNAIFCSLSDTIDKAILDAAGPSLKVVSTISVGYDHIDVVECRKRGIRLGYTQNVLTDATAELTVRLYNFLVMSAFKLIITDWTESIGSIPRNHIFTLPFFTL